MNSSDTNPSISSFGGHRLSDAAPSQEGLLSSVGTNLIWTITRDERGMIATESSTKKVLYGQDYNTVMAKIHADAVSLKYKLPVNVSVICTMNLIAPKPRRHGVITFPPQAECP